MSSQRKKPDCFARILKWVGIFFGIVLVIGIMGSNSNNNAVDDSSAATHQHQATVTATQAPTATPKPTETPKSESEKIEDLMAIIEELLSQSYDFCEVKLQDGTIVVNVTMEGIAQALAMVESYGGSAEYEVWAQTKANFLELGKEIGKSIQKYGLDNPYMLNIVNDQNHEYILLIVTQDIIFYDCLAAE